MPDSRASAPSAEPCADDPIELSKRETDVSAERRIDRSHTFRQLARTSLPFNGGHVHIALPAEHDGALPVLQSDGIGAVGNEDGAGLAAILERSGSPARARRSARVHDSHRGSAASFGLPAFAIHLPLGTEARRRGGHAGLVHAQKAKACPPRRSACGQLCLRQTTPSPRERRIPMRHR